MKMVRNSMPASAKHYLQQFHSDIVFNRYNDFITMLYNNFIVLSSMLRLTPWQCEWHVCQLEVDEKRMNKSVQRRSKHRWHETVDDHWTRNGRSHRFVDEQRQRSTFATRRHIWRRGDTATTDRSNCKQLTDGDRQSAASMLASTLTTATATRDLRKIGSRGR